MTYLRKAFKLKFVDDDLDFHPEYSQEREDLDVERYSCGHYDREGTGIFIVPNEFVRSKYFTHVEVCDECGYQEYLERERATVMVVRGAD